MKEPQIYTNGAYEVEGHMKGFWRWKKLHGRITKSIYTNVYDVGAVVKFPKYHLFWDTKPQFALIKEKKVHWKHLQDTKCEFYPCHTDIPMERFNCRFCYCPAFLIDNCPGIESGYAEILENGWKDCSNCEINHDIDQWQTIIDAVGEIIK